jgi:hypothetical protein
MKMIQMASLLVAGSLAASSAHASLNLVVNGGFETGDFTGWTPVAVSFPIYIVNTAPFVHSGNYAAQIAGYSDGPDTLSQTITTAPGQDYALNFWRYIDDGGNTTSLVVKWDNTVVYSELNTGPFETYQGISATVVGTGSDTLEFVCANDPSETYLDDVSVTAVPEPTTLVSGALMLLPFGSSVARKLRKKFQAA